MKKAPDANAPPKFNREGRGKSSRSCFEAVGGMCMAKGLKATYVIKRGFNVHETAAHCQALARLAVERTLRRDLATPCVSKVWRPVEGREEMYREYDDKC